jgi:hypothetical protein
MFSLLLSVLVKACNIKVEPTIVPLWTEEELESFVSLWLVILSVWIKTAMFLLYHSEGCNICEMVLHECYVNDLRTTTCSGMLGHHKSLCGYDCPTLLQVQTANRCESKLSGHPTWYSLPTGMVCLHVDADLSQAIAKWVVITQHLGLNEG